MLKKLLVEALAVLLLFGITLSGWALAYVIFLLILRSIGVAKLEVVLDSPIVFAYGFFSCLYAAFGIWLPIKVGLYFYEHL